MKKNLVCNKCGWVHFELSEVEVIESAKVFKEYFDVLPKEKRLSMYKKETFSIEENIRNQKKCFKCGNSNVDFHEQNDNEQLTRGTTIQGVIRGFK